MRLQRIVIGDDRFVKLGFRDEGGSSAAMIAILACLYPTMSVHATKTCHRW
ncbi:hypothetical protein ABID21_001967 [Pseudorhizobium tarimense]|uniref:Uncharacterized protein n=1 Tax=Pseudorhizobium tarimense TaxID=1079109 RepID=A0ABV2H5P5_9HYPH|nr:hypothetical protein [Pseudorhizobium tarimense]MCJ8519053.1 hypothetical protein [Pseudorhizobium tarimense]